MKLATDLGEAMAYAATSGTRRGRARRLSETARVLVTCTDFHCLRVGRR